MIAPRLVRKFGLCFLLIAALGLAAFAGIASARATPSNPPPVTEPIGGPDVSLCTGLSGTNSGTVTDEFHFVDNADGTVHVTLTETLDYRIDFVDGTYLISHSVSHNEFQASSSGVAEFSFAQQDRGTLYSADGRVIGYQTVFHREHFTMNNGTLITSNEQFRVTCS